MRDCPPPYRPFRGADPPHFVDRPSEEDLGTSGIVGAALNIYRSGPRDLRFHRLVAGGPAIGKTALLRALCRQVELRLGWAAIFHRCLAKERAMGSLSSEVVASVSRHWKEARPSRRALAGGGSSWANLKGVLEGCGRAASLLGSGILVALDDVDVLGAGEAESFGYLARRLAFEGLPVALLLSGDLSLAERFERSGYFSGTLWATELAPFDTGEAREAIVVPASERGVEFEERALEAASAAAGGSPLEIQRIGFASWAAANSRDRVTLADVDAAVGFTTGRVSLGRGSMAAVAPRGRPVRELAAMAR